jgi:hypothetical protein
VSSLYRKKPVVIEAMQWTENRSMRELSDFANGLVKLNDVDQEFFVYDRLHDTWVQFAYDDWIIKGLQGEFYPCKDDVFAASYEPVTEDEGEKHCARPVVHNWGCGCPSDTSASQPTGEVYFCPTVGEIESATHGGFTRCCSHPELHAYLGYPTPGIDAISDWLSKRAIADFKNRPTIPAAVNAVARALARNDLDNTLGKDFPMVDDDHPFWDIWRTNARVAVETLHAMEGTEKE